MVASSLEFITGAQTSALRGDYCWGLPGHYEWEKVRVAEANVLLLHSLAMAEAVSLPGGGHLIEHPEDTGGPPYPLWDTEEMSAMEERTSAVRQHIDHCMSGCPSKKATCLSGTLVGMDQFGSLCDGQLYHRHEYSLGVDENGVHARMHACTQARTRARTITRTQAGTLARTHART